MGQDIASEHSTQISSATSSSSEATNGICGGEEATNGNGESAQPSLTLSAGQDSASVQDSLVEDSTVAVSILAQVYASVDPEEIALPEPLHRRESAHPGGHFGINLPGLAMLTQVTTGHAVNLGARTPDANCSTRSPNSSRPSLSPPSVNSGHDSVVPDTTVSSSEGKSEELFQKYSISTCSGSSNNISESNGDEAVCSSSAIVDNNEKEVALSTVCAELGVTADEYFAIVAQLDGGAATEVVTNINATNNADDTSSIEIAEGYSERDDDTTCYQVASTRPANIGAQGVQCGQSSAADGGSSVSIQERLFNAQQVSAGASHASSGVETQQSHGWGVCTGGYKTWAQKHDDLWDTAFWVQDVSGFGKKDVLEKSAEKIDTEERKNKTLGWKKETLPEPQLTFLAEKYDPVEECQYFSRVTDISNYVIRAVAAVHQGWVF